MMSDLIDRLREVAIGSPFLRSVTSVRRDGGRALALGDAPVRGLTADEIAQLERLGNVAEDWGRVRVAEGFTPGRVRGCCFHGDVLLGRFSGRAQVGGGMGLPPGLYNSTFVDSVVGHDALVRDVKLVANYALGPGACLFDCGRVVCEGETAFGNGTVLAVGPETGERSLPVYAELDVETAAAATRGPDRRRFLEDYTRAVADYRGAATSGRGIIESGARIRGTPAVENTFVGAGAEIDGATVVRESTLLGGRDEAVRVESGTAVRTALLQGGARVGTLAVVERSVLAERAHVERHGRVMNSVLGPGTAVAGGEVTSCLLGPLVGAHHQALLIATLWPEGKGNVAHGASVGSNHTSRAPDQEFWAGEGMFVGLGVDVKFPADFSRAPYTVVACGATLLPQQVTFPFSLIAPPSAHHPGLSPAYNEIIPGWMLSDNLYALKRNELKYRARGRGLRTGGDWRIFRPAVIDLMRDACRRLEEAGAIREYYTEREVPGLGKNYLLEERRRQAVAAYRLSIRYHALLGLKEKVQELLRRGQWPEPNLPDVVAGLAELRAMLPAMAAEVERSKAKDDWRGARVIPDYADVHPPAGEDETIRATRAEVERLRAELQETIDCLHAFRSRSRTAGPKARAGLPDWPTALESA